MTITIMNVYSPCLNRDKYQSWDEIEHVKGNEICQVWCIIGDFNVVRNDNERKGKGNTKEKSVDIDNFNMFIRRCELNEVSII